MNIHVHAVVMQVTDEVIARAAAFHDTVCDSDREEGRVLNEQLTKDSIE